MPTPSPQEIQEFLEIIAGLLKTTVPVPDYSELFASEDQPTIGEIGLATPEEIEVALVIGLQRAEIEMQEAAEEKRVSEQWSIVEGVAQRNDSPPETPSKTALEIVDQSLLPDVLALTIAAAKAFQELSAARGEPDETFEQATANALQALDERDGGIAKQHEAVSVEINRRRQAIDETLQKFTLVDQNISPKSHQILKDEENYKSKSVKALRSALGAYTQEIKNLEALVDRDPPSVFASVYEEAGKKIEDVERKTSSVNNFARTESTKDRKEIISQLPSSPPAVADRDRSVLAPGDPGETYDKASQAWTDSFRTLSKKPGDFTDEEFEDARRRNLDDFEAAQVAADAVTKAAKLERERRDQIHEELKQQQSSVAKPQVEPKSGTDEHQTYADAVRACDNAMHAVNELRVKGVPDEFAQAEQAARETITALDKVGPVVSELADQRAKETKSLKNEIQSRANATYSSIGTELEHCPIRTLLVSAIKNAFESPVRSKAALIKGIDRQGDTKLGEELYKVFDNTKLLLAALKKLESSPFQQVSNNIEIATDLEALTSTLANPGIGPTAIAKAETLYKDAGKVAERYEEISILRQRYDEAIKDKTIEPPSQKVLQGFPAFETGKDGLKKGELTIQTTTFREAIRKIEDKIADNEEKEKKKAKSEEEWQIYIASEAYKFVQLMENPIGKNPGPVQKLESLVGEQKAKRGSIHQAYRSSYDYPDRFSVEVFVDIDGRQDVVVHAHCANDGTPGNGNACHIKLWRYRFDPGGYPLSNPLRGSLLHQPPSYRQKAEGAGLV